MGALTMSLSRVTWTVGTIAALACVQPPDSDAAARADRSFGAGKGWVTTQIPRSTSIAYDATVLPSGKIVVAGQATAKSGTGQVVVARYRSDGSLDRGFARRGIFEYLLPSGQ